MHAPTGRETFPAVGCWTNVFTNIKRFDLLLCRRTFKRSIRRSVRASLHSVQTKATRMMSVLPLLWSAYDVYESVISAALTEVCLQSDIITRTRITAKCRPTYGPTSGVDVCLYDPASAQISNINRLTARQWLIPIASCINNLEFLFTLIESPQAPTQCIWRLRCCR